MRDIDRKIFIAGSRGLAGSAIRRRLEKDGYRNLLCPVRSELDLFDAAAVDAFFRKERPEWVFLAAAKVGGIYANKKYPADFILENLKIELNVIEAAWRNGAGKLLFLGSSCIYPRMAPQPMTEDCLLTSPLEPTNEPYAIAKIAGIKLCAALRRQYGCDFISVMPTNLYGINDNYHAENAHVLPMLLKRIHEAKIEGSPFVTVWGTGRPLREFLCAEDLADAVVHLMENYSADQTGEIINIGSGEELSIAELAELIKDVVGYKGEIRFDTARPDGTPRKLLDVSKIHSLGWVHKTPLREGVRKVYLDFLEKEEGRARLS
jgi:GDP-L-fucose synthase